ncbi:MAG: CarD family transcriptional regulator [Anaerocolumna sp.]
MIQIGDYIIYGSNGVCKVENVGMLNKEGIPKDKKYYTLIPAYTRGNRIFTPVENPKVVIRPVISKEEALTIIEAMENIEVLDIAEDRRGEEVLKEVLGKYDCLETAKIFKTLYYKKLLRLGQGKKQSTRDDKYLNFAKDNLVKEMALSLGLDKDMTEKLIMKSISTLG